MLAKAPLLVAIAAFACWYIYLTAKWGARCHYAAPYVLAYSILAIATAVTASTAMLLLTRQNLQRVITSTIVMLLCTAFGSYLGDPTTQGSYDHGFGETEIGWLTGGVIGALVGWAVMTSWAAMTAGGYQRDASTRDSTDKLPNFNAPAPPKPTP